jgi:flagellar motor switch protein FliN/FliY
MDFEPSQQAESVEPAPPTVAAAEPEMERILGELQPFLSVPLQITIELGRSRAAIGQLLDMKYHSVFELHKTAGNSLDIYVNNVLLGRGEVLVFEDRVGIKINEIVEKHD